ncbi:MAG TPA: MFS transporter [Pirellulales bacterium]|nr:MFS transporter [Pirellulales bacterium]
MPVEIRSLRELSPQQWRSGAAAWLGWLFDGLDMHLYTLVAVSFVAKLLGGLSTKDPQVAACSSWIQAAFLVGWAVGGGFFGRIGDRLGRSRTLSLTILTYALFTGLSYFAQTWQQLLVFRFLAALGIGGEWAVGASLLSETWPRSWRPWIAAVLQTAVNVGVLTAAAAGYLLDEHSDQTLFLVGIVPALLVFWIRRQVPETAEWHEAKSAAKGEAPSVLALFGPSIRRTSVLTILVCSFSLTAHWAFMFWYSQQLRNLPGVIDWDEKQKRDLVSVALFMVMAASIAGNFFAAFLAKLWGYRWAIGAMCLAYFVAMWLTYCVPRDYRSLLVWLPICGACQGVFALFTMYMPPLFPTLLRTTGAGFCYNIGRLVAAAGTVFFGLFAQVGDFRLVLLYASFLFLPAAIISAALPEPSDGMDAEIEIAD